MKRLLILARVAFAAAVIYTLYAATTTPSAAVSWFPWDKAMHFTAFYGLSGLAVAAFPRRSPFLIGALLSGFGALIEGIQALPMVHRDSDFFDWVADTIAITAALTPMYLVWWRGVWRDPQKKMDR